MLSCSMLGYLGVWCLVGCYEPFVGTSCFHFQGMSRRHNPEEFNPKSELLTSPQQKCPMLSLFVLAYPTSSHHSKAEGSFGFPMFHCVRNGGTVFSWESERKY